MVPDPPLTGERGGGRGASRRKVSGGRVAVLKQQLHGNKWNGTLHDPYRSLESLDIRRNPYGC